MTTNQKSLVRETFAKVVPIADTAAGLFYGRLFEMDPSLRPLFRSDIGAQGKKLMQMIGLAVRGLQSLDTLLPAVQELGRRHRVYGVEEKDYDTVGKALLWALEQGLGADFTPQVQEAWLATYQLLAETMKQAAHSRPQATCNVVSTPATAVGMGIQVEHQDM